MSDLHGLAHRLRSAGVRPHGHLYQVRQAHERVPHLPAVRDPSRARLPVLRARAGFCSALGDRAPGVWAHGGPACRRQANQKVCSVPKTRASKDAVTSGHACLASEVHRAAGRAPGQWKLVQIAQASPCFGDLGVTMVTDGEDFTEFRPYLPPFLCEPKQSHPSSCSPPTPLSSVPLFDPLGVLVGTALFLPGTPGFISGLSGSLCFN